MKKRISFLLAVIMILTVMVPAIPTFAEGEAAAEPENTYTFLAVNDTTQEVNGYAGSYAYYSAQTEFIISTVEDLKNFYIDVYSYGWNFANKTVKLANDITFNDPASYNTWADEAPANQLLSGGDRSGESDIAFRGTFDGRTHTIFGLYNAEAPESVSGVGLFPIARGTVTIQNLTLDGFYIADKADAVNSVGALVGDFGGALTIKNCTVKNGIVAGNNDKVGGFVGTAKGSWLTIDGCTFESGTVDGGTGTAGALIGKSWANGDRNVQTQPLVIQETKVQAGVNVSGSVKGGIIGEIANECNYGDANDYAPGGYWTYFFIDSTFKPNGADDSLSPVGAYSQTYGGWNLQVSTALATNGDRPATLGAVNSAIVALKCYGTPLNFNAADENPVITNERDLLAFYNEVYGNGNTFSGKTITLQNDVTFNDTSDIANWGTTAPANKLVATGTTIGRFAGTFEGNNKTIYGLYNDTAVEGNVALFPGITGKATIQNLTLDGFYMKDTAGGYVGGLVGMTKNARLTVNNCTLKNGTVDGGTGIAGGLIGMSWAVGDNSAKTDDQALILQAVKIQETVSVIGNTKGGIIGKSINECLSSNQTEYAKGGYLTYFFIDCAISPKYSDASLAPVAVYSISSGADGGGWFLRVSTALGTNGSNLTTLAEINDAINDLGCYGPALTFDGVDNLAIYNAKDLLAFYEACNGQANSFAGKTVTLEADINLNDTSVAEWYLASDVFKLTSSNPANLSYFSGSFDGKGHTIKGLYIDQGTKYSWDESGGYAGLFSQTRNAVIKNFTVDGFYVYGDGLSAVGALVGRLDRGSEISDITLRNGTVKLVNSNTANSGVGAIFGYANENSTDLVTNSAVASATSMVIRGVVVDSSVEVIGDGVAPVGGIGGYIYANNAAGNVVIDLTGSIIQPKNYTTLNAFGKFYYAAGTGVTFSVINKNAEYTQTIVVINSENEGIFTDDFNAAANASQCYGDINVTFAGVQTKAEGDCVRFVGIVKSYSELARLGFTITANGKTHTVEVTKVYEALVAAKETITPKDGGYYFTFVVSGVPSGTSFDVCVYSETAGGTAISGTAYTYTYNPVA